MWKRSFGARPPSKSESWRCENEAFVRDSPQKSESWRCENEAFVRDNPQKVKVEDVKTKFSCETTLKKWKLKMWKRSFRARQPSKTDTSRCENEAFVRDSPQKVKVEDVKTKFSCETTLKKWKLKMWKRSFRARQPSKNWHFKMWKRSFRARQPSKSESWRCENEAFVQDNPQKLTLQDVKMKLSCKTALKKWKLKMWKRSFRARQPSKSESWRCENEAFVQDNPQKLTLQDVKTKLSCETALKKWKLKMWKRSFRARQPSKSESWRCENEALVRGLPQNLKVEVVVATWNCENDRLSVTARSRSENDQSTPETVSQRPRQCLCIFGCRRNGRMADVICF